MVTVTALCPSCGQSLPEAGQLTERELDVLAAWWMTGSVREAAELVRVGQQRAKNLLYRARIRNGVHDNHELLAQHFAAVRSIVSERMQHKWRGKEVA